LSRQFVASCYEAFLGRSVETMAIVEGRRRLNRRDILASVLGSTEFRDCVGRPLLEGRAPSGGLFDYPLTIRHRLWAMDELPVLPSSAALLGEADGWSRFLRVLLNDALLGEVVGADILRRSSEPHPALCALEAEARACRRPLLETEESLGDFGRVLGCYCGHTLDAFESVGDNCELGGLQRAAGLESLGLFRWSGVRAEPLARLLERDLAGVDDPANLSIRIKRHATGAAEYMLDHALFGADAHTFLTPADASPDEVLATETRRLRLLKRKFLEDLRSGRRIFAYRSAHPFSDAEAIRLHDAFRRHGPNRLLVVRPADQRLTEGEVQLIRSDLAVASLDEFALGMEKFSELWPCLLLRAERLLPVPVSLSMSAA
jgi:hypothetical protein